MRRRWKLWLAFVLLTVLVGALVYPPSRYCLWGWLKFEPTYRGRPVTYWREAILALRSPPTRTGIKVELIDVFWAEVQQTWERHASPRANLHLLFEDSADSHAVLLELLEDPDPMVQGYAAQCLARHRPSEPGVTRRLLDRLLQMLEHPDYSVRMGACHVFSRLGPEAGDVLPRLRTLLQSEPRNTVRIVAACAITKIDPEDEESVRFLIAMVEQHKDPEKGNWMNAAQAAWVLQEINPPPREAVPALLEAARHNDRHLSNSAINALKKIDPEAAKKAGLMKND
jgi:HEAT repeat protein